MVGLKDELVRYVEKGEKVKVSQAVRMVCEVAFQTLQTTQCDCSQRKDGVAENKAD